MKVSKNLKFSSVKNTLFLKDLLDSSTMDELADSFRNRTYDDGLSFCMTSNGDQGCSGRSLDNYNDINRHGGSKHTENSIFFNNKHTSNRPSSIYSPQFVRGTGASREGYCQACDRWFRMKTSSYWYHMNYKHGINSKGEKYPEPVLREFNGKMQGFCDPCNCWISLGNCQKTSRFLWKKHFQKEHSV